MRAGGILGVSGGELVRVQAPSEPLLIVSLEDGVLGLELGELLVQVVEYHGREQAGHAGADDGDVERLNVVGVALLEIACCVRNGVQMRLVLAFAFL